MTEMIKKLDPNDMRPTRLIGKINEIVDWINRFEAAIDVEEQELEGEDEEDNGVVEDGQSSDEHQSDG